MDDILERSKTEFVRFDSTDSDIYLTPNIFIKAGYSVNAKVNSILIRKKEHLYVQDEEDYYGYSLPSNKICDEVQIKLPFEPTSAIREVKCTRTHPFEVLKSSKICLLGLFIVLVLVGFTAVYMITKQPSIAVRNDSNVPENSSLFPTTKGPKMDPTFYYQLVGIGLCSQNRGGEWFPAVKASDLTSYENAKLACNADTKCIGYSGYWLHYDCGCPGKVSVGDECPCGLNCCENAGSYPRGHILASTGNYNITCYRKLYPKGKELLSE